MKSTRKMKILSVLMSAAMVFGTMPASIAMGAETDDIVQNLENTDDVSADDTGMDFTLSAYEGPTEDATGDPVVEETVPESEYAEEEGAGSVEAVVEDVPAEAETDENDYGIQMLYTIRTEYMDADGELKVVNATEVTNSDTTWTSEDENGGWYVVVSNLVNANRITVSGDVNLILWNDTILTASAGITVPYGSSLTIYGEYGGTGELDAYNADNASAAIGGTEGRTGSITINGGIVDAKGVNATGEGNGSGIGVGTSGYSTTVTINGGTVIATGGENGAGIGGGIFNTITINGGEVTTTGGDNGAGIGGGNGRPGGTIHITGGTVDSAGGENGAGIGGGYGRGKGTITIDGGEVTATGGTDAAGIGDGAQEPDRTYAEGTITIRGGTVNAYGGGDGAAIGGGKSVQGGQITISGGQVTADNSSLSVGGGAGIGGGGDPKTGYTIITISGGEIYAYGGGLAAGIGTGANAHQDPAITISGGKVTAFGGDYGAGIGGGDEASGGTITISKAKVYAYTEYSGAGIGGGVGGSGGKITINSGEVYADSYAGGAAIGGGGEGADGGEITINGGTVVANNYSNYGAGIGGSGGVGGGTCDGGIITINGGYVTATAGNYAAGIGGGGKGGLNAGGYAGSGGTITITDGTVIAEAGAYGAGIGGGGNSHIHGYGGNGGDITISGGVVTATGHSGAGIGRGRGGEGYGSAGTFSTTDTGNAFIVASSISDQSGKPDDWSGAIIIGSEGQVYGTPTLALDAEIPEGDILRIPEDTSLTIKSDATLTNNGTLYQDWDGAFTKEGTYTDNGEDFYEVKIDVYYYWISSQYQVEYREKTYLPSDKNITLWRDTGPYIWDVLLLGQSGNTVALTTQGSEGAQFTMPAEPVHLVQSIDIPEADQTVFTYNGSPQTYTLKESEYYTIEGNVQTDAGTYTVTVSLVDPTIYAWKDGTTEEKTYPFVINPEDDNDLPDPSDRNNIKTGTTVTVTAADLVYNGNRQNAGIVVTAKDGTVLEKGVDYILDGQTAKAAGTHKATLTGIGNYYGTTTVNYKIAKDSQKLTAKVKKTGTKKYTIKASKLKNDSRTFKIQVTKKGKMKVRYSTNNSRIKVDKNGKVTLKKGLKAGTYKIKVTTGASRNYKASKNPKYITVKVK